MSTVESLRDELKQKSREEKLAKLIELLELTRENCEVSLKTLERSQIYYPDDDALDDVIMKAHKLAALPNELIDELLLVLPY